MQWQTNGDRDGYRQEDLTDEFPESYEEGRFCSCDSEEFQYTDCATCG